MDHGSLIVRPDSEEHVSFVIARDFLLDKNASARLGAPTDHTQPFLKSKYWQQSAEDQVRNRFVYWNRELPLFGRDAEQSELNAFLEDPSRRFGWKLVLGSGGVGKSRIALELVLARRAEWWHAGFLDEQPPLEYWAKWQPARPTLIVIDYASRRSIYVGKMLASLAEREPPFLLQHPVRALLLERNTIGPWLENILGASRLLFGLHHQGAGSHAWTTY